MQFVRRHMNNLYTAISYFNENSNCGACLLNEANCYDIVGFCDKKNEYFELIDTTFEDVKYSSYKGRLIEIVESEDFCKGCVFHKDVYCYRGKRYCVAGYHYIYSDKDIIDI